jgi:ribosomal protein L7Ae-like RNA K-turn-binding protein/predicted RNA-binding protein YlxR (DUF448 family)
MVDSSHSDAHAASAAADADLRSDVDEQSSLGRPPRPNARTCVGCGRPAGLDETVQASGRQREAEGPRRPLVRLVLADGEEGQPSELAVDTGKGSFGRGAYVHGEVPCVTAAAGKGLARSAKSAVNIMGQRLTPALLAGAICDAYERRAKSLLSAAKRAGRLEAGADAAALAIREGDAALVIVASDAGAARDLTEVRKLVAEGKVLVWGDKQALSLNAFGQAREAGVGVVVVTDTRIAGALRESRMIVEALVSFATPSASILGGGAANLRGPGSAATPAPAGAKSGAKVTSVSKNQGRRKNA